MSRTTWPKLISARMFGEKVSARLAALRIDVTGDFELGEDLLEEFHRESLFSTSSPILSNGRPSSCAMPKSMERAQSVFAAFGNFHRDVELNSLDH